MAHDTGDFLPAEFPSSLDAEDPFAARFCPLGSYQLELCRAPQLRGSTGRSLQKRGASHASITLSSYHAMARDNPLENPLNLHSLHALNSVVRTAAFGLALMTACNLAAAAPGYELTRFEDPRGPGTNFIPTGINNALVVAGTAGFQRGFSLSGINDPNTGASITLFDVPTAFNNQTFGDDINNAGVIVGTYRNGTGAHGFVLDGGVFTTVDVPGARFDTLLTGINDAGVLVGQYRDANTLTFRGFVSSGAGIVLIDAAQPQPNTFAHGINNAGRVVGSVGGGGTSSRGFTFENGALQVFDAPGALWTEAYGINNVGQIVGAASTGLFVTDGTVFTTLELPASWRARNAVATDITDDGIVVGYFTDNQTNLRYGFLAAPTAVVPEPSSTLMLVAGALALMGARRYTRASSETSA